MPNSIQEVLGNDFPLTEALTDAAKADELRDRAFEYMRTLDEVCISMAKKYGLDAGSNEAHFDEMNQAIEKFVPNFKAGLELVGALRRMSVMAEQAARTAMTVTIKKMIDEGQDPSKLVKKDA